MLTIASSSPSFSTFSSLFPYFSSFLFLSVGFPYLFWQYKDSFLVWRKTRENMRLWEMFRSCISQSPTPFGSTASFHYFSCLFTIPVCFLYVFGKFKDPFSTLGSCYCIDKGKHVKIRGFYKFISLVAWLLRSLSALCSSLVFFYFPLFPLSFYRFTIDSLTV